MWPVTSHVYKRATEPGLLANTICTKPNGRKHKILYFMDIALSNSYQLLIWWKGHIYKLAQLLLSQLCDLCGNYDIKCQLSHWTSAVSCLPEYSKNAQGHTYCKQSSHGLLHTKTTQIIHTNAAWRWSKVQAEITSTQTNHNTGMESLRHSTFIQWNHCIQWNHILSQALSKCLWIIR